MASEKIISAGAMWAQRNDKVFLTINLEDCKDAKIDLFENRLVFKGTSHQNKYENTIEFYGAVIPEESKYVVLERNIPIMLKKKEEGPYWPRLLKEKNKVHWLKTDFNKWRDEDDSDVEEGQDMQLEDMMKQMGNFKAGEDMNINESEDSDDEDLPDLDA